MSDLRLCYVKDRVAYFTSHPVLSVWGDGWRKIPYENGVEPPHDEYIDLILIHVCDNVTEPKDGHYNSPWSVLDINTGRTPWLSTAVHRADPVGPDRCLWVGATPDEYRQFIRANGGKTYAEETQ